MDQKFKDYRIPVDAKIKYNVLGNDSCIGCLFFKAICELEPSKKYSYGGIYCFDGERHFKFKHNISFIFKKL